MHNVKSRWAGVLLLTFFSASTVIAQESRATITGTVFDQQGGAIPGATVTVKQLATNLERTTTTNDSGLYVLPFLNSGTYSLTVTAAGFKAAVGDRKSVV